MTKINRFIALALAGVLTITSAPVTSSAAVKTGWASNNTVYYRNGKKVIGLHKIGKKYYYFNSKGKMEKSTWKTINKNRYYFRKAGYAATGLVKIGKSYYLFRSNGKRYGTGLVKYGKKNYLLNNGRVLTGLQRYKGKLYYGTTKGLKTGWVTVKGKKYYFRKAGYAATGNLTIKGKKYTFSSSGVLTSSGNSVSKPDNVISVKLDKTEISVKMNDVVKLLATVKTSGSQKRTVKWTVSDKKVLSLETKDERNATVTPLKEGTATVTVSVEGVSSTCKIIVKPYNYKIVPMLAPFNTYFYVETDDPDPSDIRFVDKFSIYYGTGNTERAALIPAKDRFLDVKYEDKESGKVAGGFIFVNNGGYGMDGGMLTLQRASKEDSSYEDRTYTDTSITVSCPAVKPADQYLIDTYTTRTATLFDNLDSVERALYNLAVYPRSVVNTGKQNKVMPYPFLATSRYAEISLNTHIEMYPRSDEYILISSLYPFVLDSLAFPGLMAAVAKTLDPTCEVTGGYIHSMVNVTKNGETHSYGGAGMGSHNPVYSSHVQTRFTFDKSEGDYAFSATLDDLTRKVEEYGEMADDDAEKNLDKIAGDTYKKTVAAGSWIRVGMEGWWLCNNEVMADTYQTTYTYVTQGDAIMDPSENDIYISSVKNVWVDGRYIDKWNRFEKGAKFSDYPTADILIRGMTYTDYYGNVRTGDVCFKYDATSDTWRSKAYFYYDRNWYTIKDVPLPDEFILTRAEVTAMKPDRNRDKDPEKGYIYDGTVEPGTMFTN